MSSIGFDSCFYDRLDQFSKALNHVLLASRGKQQLATDSDWKQILELVKTLSAQDGQSVAATSVAACLKLSPSGSQKWQVIVDALEARTVDEGTAKCLFSLAWSLDEERAAVLMRMRQGYA